MGGCLEDRDSEKLLPYEALLENIAHVVYRLDLVNGRFEYISGAASKLFGLELDAIRDAGVNLVSAHMLPGDYESAMERIREAAAGRPGQRTVLSVDYRLIGADGRLRHCHDSMIFEVDPDGRPMVACGVVVDVSEQIIAADAMREKEAQFRATMEVAQVGMFLLQDGLFRYVNPFLIDLVGYSESELVGRMSPLDLIVPEQRDMVREKIRQRAAGEPGTPYELTGVRKDGSTLPVMILGSPTTFEGRPASVGTLLDISAQKEAEMRVRELADFDPLTGLPNRRLLRDRSTQLLAAAERDGSEMALIFIDLDHFKRVNDSLGHSIGDELLCAVAQRLADGTRGEGRMLVALVRHLIDDGDAEA